MTKALPKQRAPALAWAGIVLIALITCPPVDGAPDAARAQVYRCQGPQGAIEFRQEPCPAGSQQEALSIEDHPIGWTPLPDGSRAGPTAPSPRKPAARRGSAASSSRERRVQECTKKRQQVEDIDRKLRLGTSGRHGADLRHRRARLEDFLFESCN